MPLIDQKANVMPLKYQDSKWLYTEYYEKGRSITNIADELGVDHTTISKWRRKLEIPEHVKTMILVCPVCGKEFKRWKSKVSRTKYTNVCSRECLYDARSKGIIGREVKDGYDTDHLKRRIKVECQVCGEEFEVTPSVFGDPDRGKYCSRECYLRAKSEAMKGEGNRAYIDGRSYERMKFRGWKWHKLREEIIRRDNERCTNCEINRLDHRRLYKQDLNVHHIEPYREQGNNDPSNLVTLCVKCHSEVEKEVSICPS